MTDSRVILGIDPGTNVLGFGVVRVDECGKPVYVDMGVLDLRKETDPYSKLSLINVTVGELCDRYSVTDLAVESPFYAKNAQVIFKLGRAQGAAIAAAAFRSIPVVEYAPRKAKVAICGNGAASKEQVGIMVEKILNIDLDPGFLDATDALAIALCHYYQLTIPFPDATGANSWEKFVTDNPGRVKF